MKEYPCQTCIWDGECELSDTYNAFINESCDYYTSLNDDEEIDTANIFKELWNQYIKENN